MGERRGEVHTGFWGGNLREGDYLEDLGIDGMIILKWNIQIGWDITDWIDLAQDGDKWWAVVNTVMNLQVP
jgi:uncharacterized protein YjcR